MLLVLYIVNQWIRLDVNHGTPASVADTADDEGFGLLSMGESGVVTCDVLGANSQPVKLGLLKVVGRHSVLCTPVLPRRTATDGFNALWALLVRYRIHPCPAVALKGERRQGWGRE
jgi:hypothetical protein